MRSTFKVLFYLKRDKQKTNGMIPLYCRITVDGQEARFGMKCDVNPKFWDVKTGKATGRTTETVKINALAENTKAAIYKVYRELQERDNYVTAERVKNVFLGAETKQQTLLELFDRHNRERETQIGVTICKINYYYYIRTRALLSDFLRQQYNVSDIPIRDIDQRFITNFRTYLVVNYQYAHNTLAKHLKNLRHVISIAIDEEIISKNPFAKHNVQYQNSDRGFLTEEEIDRLVACKFEESELKLEKSRDVFLFCSFTGLSYSDLCSLREENIQKSFDGKLWIKGRRNKTDVEYNIPILDIPKMILEKYATSKFYGKLLPVPEYQCYRSRLKKLEKKCDINKHISSHLARHTFATYTLTKGVSIESVSKMLGHRNIKTTQIYAKITNEKVSNEMNMFAGNIKKGDTKQQPAIGKAVENLLKALKIPTGKASDAVWGSLIAKVWNKTPDIDRQTFAEELKSNEIKPKTLQDFYVMLIDFFLDTITNQRGYLSLNNREFPDTETKLAVNY